MVCQTLPGFGWLRLAAVVAPTHTQEEKEEKKKEKQLKKRVIPLGPCSFNRTQTIVCFSISSSFFSFFFLLAASSGWRIRASSLNRHSFCLVSTRLIKTHREKIQRGWSCSSVLMSFFSPDLHHALDSFLFPQWFQSFLFRNKKSWITK